MSYLLEIVAGAAASLGVTYWTLSIATGVRTGRALARTAQVGTSADGEVGEVGEVGAHGRGGASPRVSIVIAARDEAATIAASIDSFEHLRWPDLEIVLVDDRSTDATGAFIRCGCCARRAHSGRARARAARALARQGACARPGHACGDR